MVAEFSEPLMLFPSSPGRDVLSPSTMLLLLSIIRL